MLHVAPVERPGFFLNQPMKTQIDVDGELWAKFREKVHSEGKTLSQVVPTVIEPALRAYVDPLVIVDRLTKPTPPPPTTERRCESCDCVTDRLFLSPSSQRVCYKCWKKGITEPSPKPTPLEAK